VKRPHLFEDFKAKRREATMIVTTTNDVADHRIVKYLGIVRGVPGAFAQRIWNHRSRAALTG
jgi:uncharacterized protein YbjQ (UPF0145 family)